VAGPREFVPPAPSLGVRVGSLMVMALNPRNLGSIGYGYPSSAVQRWGDKSDAGSASIKRKEGFIKPLTLLKAERALRESHSRFHCRRIQR